MKVAMIMTMADHAAKPQEVNTKVFFALLKVFGGMWAGKKGPMLWRFQTIGDYMAPGAYLGNFD